MGEWGDEGLSGEDIGRLTVDKRRYRGNMAPASVFEVVSGDDTSGIVISAVECAREELDRR